MKSRWVVCDGCQARLRTSSPAMPRGTTCPRCGAELSAAEPRSAHGPHAATRPLVSIVLCALTGLMGLVLAGRSFSGAGLPFAAGHNQSNPDQAPLPRPPCCVGPTRSRMLSNQRRPIAPASCPKPEATPAPPREVPVSVPSTPTNADHGPDTAARRVEELCPPPPSAPTAAPERPAAPLLPKTLDTARRILANLVVGPITESRRVRVADEDGRVMVARVYGPPEFGWVLLPDGRLARTNRLIDTTEPFRPLSPEELCESLKDHEFPDFDCKITDHYVIFYQSSKDFAVASATLLESLYQGLLKKLPEKGIAVHPAEFPLVAVIYRNESDFRARRRVEPDVQAYYEIVSNRIFFYEKRDRDREDPRAAAMRQPQTVAHEGTHQVLQNIGVQPRLARWPVWLVEGLAELASATTTDKGRWAGFSVVNPFHMATIHDLDGNRLLHARGQRMASDHVGRDRGASTARYLATREDLTPTDYALAWALTHYLANQQTEKFVAFLKKMSQMEPLRPRSPAEHLADFQAAFGDDLPAIDRHVRKHLSTLHYPKPIYYAVMFEQPLPEGLVRRGTLVSQSPMVIREWFQQNLAPHGGPYLWQAIPFRSQSRAILYTEQWLRSQGLP